MTTAIALVSASSVIIAIALAVAFRRHRHRYIKSLSEPMEYQPPARTRVWGGGIEA